MAEEAEFPKDCTAGLKDKPPKNAKVPVYTLLKEYVGHIESGTKKWTGRPLPKSGPGVQPGGKAKLRYGPQGGCNNGEFEVQVQEVRTYENAKDMIKDIGFSQLMPKANNK